MEGVINIHVTAPFVLHDLFWHTLRPCKISTGCNVFVKDSQLLSQKVTVEGSTACFPHLGLFARTSGWKYRAACHVLAGHVLHLQACLYPSKALEKIIRFLSIFILRLIRHWLTTSTCKSVITDKAFFFPSLDIFLATGGPLLLPRVHTPNIYAQRWIQIKRCLSPVGHMLGRSLHCFPHQHIEMNNSVSDCFPPAFNEHTAVWKTCETMWNYQCILCL